MTMIKLHAQMREYILILKECQACSALAGNVDKKEAFKEALIIFKEIFNVTAEKEEALMSSTHQSQEVES